MKKVNNQPASSYGTNLWPKNFCSAQKLGFVQVMLDYAT
jgi:hypothetical protein